VASPSVFVVLGMHKSGTSLVASALHNSGITMVPPEQHIPASYDAGAKYEWGAFKSHNRRLLGCNPRDSLSIDLYRKLSPQAAEASGACSLINGATRRFADWGFKDPRTTLAYPFWRDLLPRHRVIAIYRRPMEVCLHYSRQHAGRPKASCATEASRHWQYYNSRILEYCEQARHPMLVLCYERLLAGDDEWHRFERFADRPLPDVRDRALYRCVVPRRITAPTASCELFADVILERLEWRRTQDP
jgi:hypothetical protein